MSLNLHIAGQDTEIPTSGIGFGSHHQEGGEEGLTAVELRGLVHLYLKA